MVDPETFGFRMVVLTSKTLGYGPLWLVTPITNDLLLVCRIDLDVLVVRKSIDCHTNDKRSSNG